MQLEKLKAEKAVGIAKRDMEIATLNLRSYTVLQDTEKISLSLPGATVNMQVQTDKVLSEAFANRSDAIAFVRRIDVRVITAINKGLDEMVDKGTFREDLL